MSQLKSCSEMRSLLHCSKAQMTLDKALPRAPWVSYSSWKATIVSGGETVSNNSIWWGKVLYQYTKQEAGSKGDVELGRESWESCSKFTARTYGQVAKSNLMVQCQPHMWEWPSHLKGIKQSRQFAYVTSRLLDVKKLAFVLSSYLFVMLQWNSAFFIYYHGITFETDNLAPNLSFTTF